MAEVATTHAQRVTLRRARILAACIAAITLGFPFVAQADVDPIDPSVGNDISQVSPKTDGETVVWAELPASALDGGDIYGMRLADGVVFPIAVGPSEQTEPDVDDGVVVWKDEPVDDNCSGCNRSVYGKVLATGEQFVIAEREELEDHLPAISGDWVVWQAFGDSGTSLWARNIGGVRHGQPLGEPILVYEYPSEYGSRPPLVFDDERVVWAEYRTEQSGDLWRFRILTIKIGESTPLVLVDEYGYTGSPHGFDLNEDVLVCTNGFFWLEALNLASGEQIALIDGEAANREPATDGRYIFFLRSKRIALDLVYDLWGYDVISRSLFPVALGTEWVISADTAEGVVVWSRRNGDISRVFAAHISDNLPSARQPAPDETGPNLMFFPETGHSLIFGFKGYWERNGGLPVFGYPMTQEFQAQQPDGETFATVQYFERQRFEWHPEREGTSYEVLLGRLGAEDAVRRELLGDPAFQPIAAADADCTYFEPTGHQVCGAFQTYWREHGLELGDGGVSHRESLALFGYPLSEPFVDPATGLLTQYFERAVFELHPDNPEPYNVLLRRLGAEELARWDW